MIVQIFHENLKQTETYAFTQSEIYIGRNPSYKNSVTINSETISRNHLKVTVQEGIVEIIDLGSSNGTFVNGEKIQIKQRYSLNKSDEVKLAQFQAFLKFQIRQSDLKIQKPSKLITKVKQKQKNSSDEEQESQRSRSRQKIKSSSIPIKLSESTLKMLKDMTINKKTKSQRIKFLKLMGYPKAEEYWEAIEELLKQKKGSKDSQKAAEELQKQFNLSRGGHEKRGLGKN